MIVTYVNINSNYHQCVDFFIFLALIHSDYDYWISLLSGLKITMYNSIGPILFLNMDVFTRCILAPISLQEGEKRWGRRDRGEKMGEGIGIRWPIIK